ncbi:MAG: sialidase family protein [Ferruginibacter sp.]
MKKSISIIKITVAILCLGTISCTNNGKIKKISEEWVYTNPPFAQCHASTIEEVAPNKFMISAFGGTKEKDPDVCIWLSSEENGEWKQPVKIADGIMNDTLRYPTWNPVLFKANEGKLFLFYKVGPNPRDWWGMVMTSEDNGKNWSVPERLPNGILGPIKNKPIQLANGTIISPSSTETNTNEGPNCKAHIERSADLGKTWQIIPIDPNTEFNVIQPSILEYPNNKLEVLCRSRENSVMQAYSNDNGTTWGSFTKTDLPNPNSGTDAVTLKNGWHVLVYNPTVKGKGGRAKLNMAISKDGKKWVDKVLLENEEQGEFSYPAVIQAQDGKIHVTYTFNRINVKHVILDWVN